MVNINGIEWGYHLVAPFHPILERANRQYSLGCCDNLTHDIYINSEISYELRKRVLCHEIVHAAMFSYGVELTVSQEEMVADLISRYGSEIIDISNYIQP